jgi:c-di-GMP-related signal transduction protein
MTTSAPTPATAHPSPAEPDSNAGTIARQAIVDDKGKVFGYELFDRSRPFSTHDASSDAQMLLNVLSHADTASLLGTRKIFVNCTIVSLKSEHLDLIDPDRLVLEIPLVTGHDRAEIESALATLTALRGRGFKLAFNHNVLNAAYKAWIPLASFIKIDLLTLKPELIEPVIKAVQKKSGAQIVVEKIETAEQHQQVAALGVALFQGYWFSKPVLVSGKSIQPEHAVIIQLINAVRQQETTVQIEQILKRDATLAFNLLRYINSSGFGLNTEITSFRHAVMILGLQKLFRWAALLLTLPRAGGVPPAVGHTAIVRGRLMELLAGELLPPDECDNAFVAGVFSLLDTMLGIPLDQAIAAVTLPETVTAALLHKTGPLGPLLELTIACESADDAAFARLAEALVLSNHQINWAHLEALAWAETMGA